MNYEDEEETKYELTNDDYFVISTNKKSFEKNSQILIIMAFGIMNIFWRIWAFVSWIIPEIRQRWF